MMGVNVDLFVFVFLLEKFALTRIWTQVTRFQPVLPTSSATLVLPFDIIRRFWRKFFWKNITYLSQTNFRSAARLPKWDIGIDSISHLDLCLWSGFVGYHVMMPWCELPNLALISIFCPPWCFLDFSYHQMPAFKKYSCALNKGPSIRMLYWLS